MSPPDHLKVAAIQMRMVADVDTNRKRCLDFIHQAADAGADVVVTPELFTSLYFCQREDAALFSLAEAIPDGPTCQALAAVAKARNIVIVGSIFEKRAPGLYHNAAVVFDRDGSMAGKYRKMHIPDDPNYYEKFYFTPGDLGFQAIDTTAGKLGTLVCWDQWYPEGARLTAMKGARMLFYPTAIGAHEREAEGMDAVHRDAWVTIQRSHAIANGLFVVAANRTGVEEEMKFWGSSFIADPMGQVLAQASTDQEEVIMADINFIDTDVAREGWPFFRDRRIDAYDALTQRWLD